MSKITHVVVLLGYTGIASFIGYSLPADLLNFQEHATWFVAGVVLLAGLLAHEAVTRCQNEGTALQRLLVLRRAYNSALEELDRTRQEVHQIYQAMDIVGKDTAEGGKELEKVASEVRVLHALVEELYSTGGGQSEPVLPQLPEDPKFEEELHKNNSFSPINSSNIENLSDKDMLNIIRDALRQNRVDLYLQPIVSLPQRKQQYFECFSAVRNDEGRVITPDHYLEIAKKSGLIKAIDNMLLFRCIQLIKKIQQHNYSTCFFCNVSPVTRTDREFFQEFREYLERNEDMAPSIIFEFSQTDIAEHPEEVFEDIERLQKAGYRFCVDHVLDLEFDAQTLAETGFSFVKIGAEKLITKIPIENTDTDRIINLKRVLDAAKIELIVGNIETENIVENLLECDIDYGQGNLFGEPRLSEDQPSLAPMNLDEIT